jgi:hypothetical protein
MILVVADTGPLRYLIVIEAIGLLPRLYDRVIIPSEVLAELRHPNAPLAVKTWASFVLTTKRETPGRVRPPTSTGGQRGNGARGPREKNHPGQGASQFFWMCD